MRQRFTVIEGGAGTGPATADLAGPPQWRIDLRRPAYVGAGEIAAWRGLLVRSGAVESVYADPDFLLPAAQHQAGGRDLVFAFAWTHGNGPDRLHGVIPLAMPHSLWGNGHIAAWQPHGLSVAPTVEAASFEDVRAALEDHLRSVRPRVVLTLTADSAARSPATPWTLRALPRRTAIPTASLVGIRPADTSPQERPAVERISEPERIRDAVEAFLIADAAISAAPTIGDPSEAAMVRVVMRLFARRRQASVELTRRGDVVVAASLRLGAGPQAVVWRHVAGAVDRRARTA